MQAEARPRPPRRAPGPCLSTSVAVAAAAAVRRRVKLRVSGAVLRFSAVPLPPEQHASPPADMGFTRSEWKLTTGSAAACVRVQGSVSRGNGAAI